MSLQKQEEMPLFWLFAFLQFNFCSSAQQIIPIINNNGTENGKIDAREEEVKMDAEWACGTDEFSRVNIK
jgi:hypothetical protein